MDKMLISLEHMINTYDLNIRGVIHIGAHYGQEYELYRKYGIRNMLFFEPVKDNYKELVKHLPKNDICIKTYNLALGNKIGTGTMYIEKVKGQSCSLLAPKTHLELSPHIIFTDKELVKITKLDNIKFNRNRFNMINIDVQGYELEVFRGSVETLKHIDIIYSEVNFEEVYENCCRIEQLDEFLNGFGFVRVLTKDSRLRRDRMSWGDALYLRNGRIN